jgi:hypothetical protein
MLIARRLSSSFPLGLFGFAIAGLAAQACASQAPPGNTKSELTSGSGTSPLASIAEGQLGCGACGGTGSNGQSCATYGNSCNDNAAGGWCADFVGWVWAQGGFDTSGLTAGAASFYEYGQTNNTLHFDNPQVGDAVVWGYSNGYADHVEIVVDVSNASNGSITGISGNGCDSIVCQDHPCSTSGECDSYTSGWVLSGFISPAGAGNGGTEDGGAPPSSGGDGGGGSGASGGDPCSSISDGLYCGNDPDYNGGNSDPNTLYRCSGGATAGTEECPSGCTTAPGTQDDYCNGSPPGYAFSLRRSADRRNDVQLALGATTTIPFEWHEAPGVAPPADLWIQVDGRTVLQVAAIGDRPFVRAGVDLVPIEPDTQYGLVFDRENDSLTVEIAGPMGTVLRTQTPPCALVDVELPGATWRSAVVSTSLQ